MTALGGWLRLAAAVLQLAEYPLRCPVPVAVRAELVAVEQPLDVRLGEHRVRQLVKFSNVPDPAVGIMYGTENKVLALRQIVC